MAQPVRLSIFVGPDLMRSSFSSAVSGITSNMRAEALLRVIGSSQAYSSTGLTRSSQVGIAMI